ncbi:hypothetical protein ACIPSA_46550 [Streptomyces sp. NPDC086549]|uniref:hypothetical protein n=1 Tax=Streptomyces sp. NPDC086549 TaxID=3365752 RepID=UPI0038172460
MDLDGRATDADTQFHDPLRRLGPMEPAVFFLGLPLLQGCDLGVDAPQPHGVPHTQSAQTVQVGRQVIEHIFDSRAMIGCHALACSIFRSIM